MRHSFFLAALFLLHYNIVHAQTPPVVHNNNLALNWICTVQENAVRLAFDPTTAELYYNTIVGDVWQINVETTEEHLVFTADDHGISNLQGFTIGPNGNMFLVGNEQVSDGEMTVAIVVRGERTVAGKQDRTFIELARSAPYHRTGFFDHLFNGIVVSPDGAHVFVNSGANTDHGENQSESQSVADVREEPITTKIFKLPADATNLLLENDLTSLENAGYIYSYGVRNSFDLAFNTSGHLFATENSGDRDDAEEINWLREGHHYGFPWQMGSTSTPQQFAGYVPASDVFVNPASWAASSGFFHDDPNYPLPPAGVTFTEPILNMGPDGDKFRDEADGQIKDASDLGRSISSLTPHRSPLGLAFDVQLQMGEPFYGDGFVTSWTPETSVLMAPFGDEGEDLLHLELTMNGDGSNYEMNATRIISNFRQPVDVQIIQNRLYVLENNSEANFPALWEVVFPEAVSSVLGTEESPSVTFKLNGSYPNPTTGRSQLSYRLERAQQIDIAVFDIMGRKMTDLVSAFQIEGDYTTPIDLTSTNPGIYFVRMTAGSGSVVQRITVLR